MKKLLTFSFTALLLIAFFIFSPFRLDGKSGHNSVSNSIFCDSASDCRHEIGHMMDDELGSPSKSNEFIESLLAYTYAQIKYFDAESDEFVNAVFGTGGMLYYNAEYRAFGARNFGYPQEELYANIYVIADGDVDSLPFNIQPFYSADPKYINLYNCLISAPAKLCGTALHIEKR